MSMASSRRAAAQRVLAVVGAVFVAFLVIGLALPVLPLHAHQDLGLGTFSIQSTQPCGRYAPGWRGRCAEVRRDFTSTLAA